MRIVFVEFEEPVFTNRFVVRFLDHPGSARSRIEKTLKKNAHVSGFAEYEDLAIIVPQSEEAVPLCRAHLKTICVETECPHGSFLKRFACR
jgi:hypothetical protein